MERKRLKSREGMEGEQDVQPLQRDVSTDEWSKKLEIGSAAHRGVFNGTA